MKYIIRLSAILMTLVLMTLFIPITAYAVADVEITSINVTPTTLAPKGGEITLEVTIKNTGTTTLYQQVVEVYLLPGVLSFYHTETIAVGASKTLVNTVVLEEAHIGVDIDIFLFAKDTTLWRNKSGVFHVKSEENIFRSSGGENPEKSVYYVGETVQVTDSMKNILAIEATDVSVEYYFKNAQSTTIKNPVVLGTVAGNTSVDNIFDYIFTVDDIGDLRIGSKLTYTVSGLGPYNEFNIAHDFVVEPAPTPSPTIEPTDTPATTTAPTETAEIATQTDDVSSDSDASDKDSEDAKDDETDTSQDSFLNATIADQPAMLFLIIGIGLVVLLLIILIIVVIVRKK